LFYNDRVDEIRIRVWENIPLITVPRTFASNPAGGYGYPRMFRLKGKLASIHECRDAMCCCFCPYTVFQAKSSEQYTYKDKHTQVAERNPPDKHDQHTGKEQEYSRR